MQHPNGAGQLDLLAAQDEHLALDAPQIGQLVARGIAAAIDDPIRPGRQSPGVHAETNDDILHLFEALEQRLHRRARLQMRFPRKIEGGRKPPGEVGLERRESAPVQCLEAARAAGEIRELGPVARRRDHETAGDMRDGHLARPKRQRLRAEFGDQRFGALQFAPGRDHAAREKGAASPRPRTPNGKQIGAERAGVAVGDRGLIPVDSQMRTNVAHIYAIGDIAGQPMLAHKAVHEGHVAAEAAAGLKSHFDARVIPSVAYTVPRSPRLA